MTGDLTLFTQPRSAVWESDFPSVARSSRAIMGECGQRRMMVLERRFNVLFQSDPRVVTVPDKRAYA
jgi:hypothetical protein